MVAKGTDRLSCLFGVGGKGVLGVDWTGWRWEEDEVGMSDWIGLKALA